MKAKKINIRPCPFCYNSKDFYISRGYKGDSYYVECRRCWTIGPASPNESTAVVRWNKRKRLTWTLKAKQKRTSIR